MSSPIDQALLREIDQLRATGLVGEPIVPVSAEPNELARQLRDTLQELEASRTQQSNLRASLKKQDEQGELVRRVSEQVQTVQQKLISKEAEIKRLHEENLKSASELRTMREEQASWGGHLDLAQTKYGLAEKELRARDAVMAELQQSVDKRELKTRSALKQASRARQERAVVQLRRHLAHHQHRIQRSAFAALATNMALDRIEGRWRLRLKSAHGKVHTQVSAVQQRVSKVIERCRSDEEQIQDLLQQKEELEVALEEEEIKNDELTESLEKTEKEFEQLLSQLGA